MRDKKKKKARKKASERLKREKQGSRFHFFRVIDLKSDMFVAQENFDAVPVQKDKVVFSFSSLVSLVGAPFLGSGSEGDAHSGKMEIIDQKSQYKKMLIY